MLQHAVKTILDILACTELIKKENDDDDEPGEKQKAHSSKSIHSYSIPIHKP